MTPPEHEHSAIIDKAAAWLCITPKHERPRPAIIELRDRFGLSALDAVAAIAEANRVRGASG